MLQITERLTDGTGDFDPEALLKKLPEDLALPEKKVANQMRTLAKDRRHTTLVQVCHLASCMKPHPASLADRLLTTPQPTLSAAHQARHPEVLEPPSGGGPAPLAVPGVCHHACCRSSGCACCLQAISLLRQKKLDDTVKSLNNLLACDRALPADRAVSWDERSELQDLYSTYVSRVRRGRSTRASLLCSCHRCRAVVFFDHPTAEPPLCCSRHGKGGA